jgi:hypothetical protein
MWVVGRKTRTSKGKAWLFWDGAGWSPDRGAGKAFAAREEAVAQHAALLLAQKWLDGENPLVVKK